MLTSKRNINNTLRITVSDEYKYLVNISVFDSNNRIIENQSSNWNGILFSLIQGLYTLRVEMNGNIKDEVIFLDTDKEYAIANENNIPDYNSIVISPPKQYSSALLGDTYVSSHEYYTRPAVEWSRKETLRNNDIIKPNSSLFIFLRFPSIEKFDNFKKKSTKPFFLDFEIVDEYGNVLTQFETKNGIEINEQHGWITFNTILQNGIYYLIYRGKEPRQVPIYVFKNWHTQFFMTLSEQPLFGTIRIFLSKQRIFNPNDRFHKYIDILLDKLQNQDYKLDEELIEMTAHGKFESPMLGLICSYAYLQSDDTKNDNLFDIITRNMQNIILKDNIESPDLRALSILASNHLAEYKYKKTSIQGTPMLRIGFETILKASVQNKRLILQNSINDYISENLYFDSPFNTFKPIPFKKRRQKKEKRISDNEKTLLDFNKHIDVDQKEVSFNLDNEDHLLKYTEEKEISFNLEMLYPKRFTERIDKYSTSIKNLYDERLFSYINTNETNIQNSWVKNSMASIIKTNEDISINDISSDLNISGSTVIRIFNDWEKEANKK